MERGRSRESEDDVTTAERTVKVIKWLEQLDKRADEDSARGHYDERTGYVLISSVLANLRPSPDETPQPPQVEKTSDDALSDTNTMNEVAPRRQQQREEIKPDVPHPSTYIREELRARRWSRDRLAVKMGGDFGLNRLSLDLYFAVGPTDTNCRIGSETAFQLARAFGVSADLFLNLEKAWLATQEPPKESNVAGPTPAGEGPISSGDPASGPTGSTPSDAGAPKLSNHVGCGSLDDAGQCERCDQIRRIVSQVVPYGCEFQPTATDQRCSAGTIGCRLRHEKLESAGAPKENT